jgi:endonuclease/exonuclease/phosphatase (EEP) superfamily protein YafD
VDYVLWVVTAGAGAWLLLWRWLGDRCGWLGMVNAWAEWCVALLQGLGIVGLLRHRWAQSAAAFGLLAVGATYRARLPLFSLLRPFPTESRDTKAEIPGGDSTLTLFNANLLKKSRSASAHVGLIRQHQPDVVCFQELTPTLAEELVSALSDEYPHCAWRPRPDSYGLGVLSRFPLEETGYWETPGVEPWGQRVRCVLPGGQEAEIYNVHLAPPTAKSTLRKGMTWGFRTREEQVRVLQGEIEGRGLPACIVGDHNFTDSNDAYRVACERLEDAWTEVGRGRRWTWPARGFPSNYVPWAPRLLRLDYCFHNGKMKARAMEILTERTGSDHCPLLVTLAVD